MSLLTKAKKHYYGNLNEKNVTDNKIFWKAIKPVLLNKSVSNEKITLVENQKILITDNEVEITLNDISNTIKISDISKFDRSDPVSDNLNNSILKAILKYLKHPSILILSQLFMLH